MLTPEQQFRENIDKQLTQSGWLVQDFKELNPSASLGVAVREYPTESGSADYILFVDRKPIDVIEAKREGITLSAAYDQITRFTTDELKFIFKKEELPFQNESTEIETYISDAHDPFLGRREIFLFNKSAIFHFYLKRKS